MATDEAAPATVLLVFGRGVVAAGERYRLTPGSQARVEAAAGYVTAHADAFDRAARRGHRPRIVFSGGWAEACEDAGEPPAGCREGDLMVRAARAAGLDRYAELRAESRSRSTLENLIHTAGDGLLTGYAFSAAHPLGIVSHAWHLPRVRYLAGKVLGLRGGALLDVPVLGGDAPAGPASERLARLAARFWLAGARRTTVYLRRERRLVASVRLAERVLRRGRR
ncbi:YdcF family protein [Micromonosporaceae bacterium Da 78-11]